jgi:hypothetical protein
VRRQDSRIELGLALAALVVAPQRALGWGWNVHRLINRAATQDLPPAFHGFAQWADSLALLATAADERKSTTPGESIKHFIDIDNYDAFLSGDLPHSYDRLVAQYGQPYVDHNGTVPWAIVASVSDLEQSFRAHDWRRVVRVAADVGHYVGDSHEPLHLTANFDGQNTGQRGVHGRHETQMTDRHLTELLPRPSEAVAYTEPLEAVFAWIDNEYPGADLILDADRRATDAASGDTTSSETYYTVMWDLTGAATQGWVRDSALAVAGMWYTAWLAAGSPRLPGDPANAVPEAHVLWLGPSRPNPFNPTTSLFFEVPQAGPAHVVILDARGRLVRNLIESRVPAAKQSVVWDGRDDLGRSVSSGVYVARLEQAGFHAETKTVLVR